jgi:predicted enzyme related to lactoylglutathione lyase
VSDSRENPVGRIGWVDLTVPDAVALRDFYAGVVGWEFDPHPMGDYEDFSMKEPGGGKVVAGICHARGVNSGMPPQWLLYIAVADLESSLENVRTRGGKQVGDVRELGAYGRMCVIEDPAGAVVALIQPPES